MIGLSNYTKRAVEKFMNEGFWKPLDKSNEVIEIPKPTRRMKDKNKTLEEIFVQPRETETRITRPENQMIRNIDENNNKFDKIVLEESKKNIYNLFVSAGILETSIKKESMITSITPEMKRLAKIAALATYKAVIKMATEEKCPHCKGEDKDCKFCSKDSDESDANDKPLPCPPGVPLCQ
jgi:excinuclease UvrABC ATPase subunit